MMGRKEKVRTLPMVGQTLGGRYQILEALGSSGQTYLAQDSHHPERLRVVLKRWQAGQNAPHREHSEDSASLRHLFQQEVVLREHLGSHEGIPRLLACFEQEGEFYWVEEWVEGPTLEQALLLGNATERGQLTTPSRQMHCHWGHDWTEAEVRALLQDVLQTLAFLNGEGVSCCNLQPSRLIYRQADGRWVLLKWGGEEQGLAFSGSGFGNPYGPRHCSDLYALGLIALQALCGIPPQKLFRDPLTGELRWHDLASTSAPFAAFLDRLVSCNPQQCFPSATAALAALQALPPAESPPCRRTPVPAQPCRRRALTGANHPTAFSGIAAGASPDPTGLGRRQLGGFAGVDGGRGMADEGKPWPAGGAQGFCPPHENGILWPGKAQRPGTPSYSRERFSCLRPHRRHGRGSVA
jgi:serine/threonine protein kinase